MSHRGGTLVTVYTAVLSINLDITIANIAFPSIATERTAAVAADPNQPDWDFQSSVATIKRSVPVWRLITTNSWKPVNPTT